MSELKPRITENGIDYILVGDYYIPDLKLPEEHRPIGKYGRMHREYLREVHPARLNTLIDAVSEKEKEFYEQSYYDVRRMWFWKDYLRQEKRTGRIYQTFH